MRELRGFCDAIYTVNKVNFGEVAMTQFSDDWLQHKPKFRLHQSLIATPGVVGRVSGIQQMESGGWRYQILTPAQYGVTLSWWDEDQLSPTMDRFTVILVENGEEVEGCCAGTLDEAVDDAKAYMEEASRQYREYDRRMSVQITCCNMPDLENEETPTESFEASFSPSLC
jgi:hypothetical protein